MSAREERTLARYLNDEANDVAAIDAMRDRVRSDLQQRGILSTPQQDRHRVAGNSSFQRLALVAALTLVLIGGAALLVPMGREASVELEATEMSRLASATLRERLATYSAANTGVVETRDGIDLHAADIDGRLRLFVLEGVSVAEATDDLVASLVDVEVMSRVAASDSLVVITMRSGEGTSLIGVHLGGQRYLSTNGVDREYQARFYQLTDGTAVAWIDGTNETADIFGQLVDELTAN